VLFKQPTRCDIRNRCIAAGGQVLAPTRRTAAGQHRSVTEVGLGAAQRGLMAGSACQVRSVDLVGHRVG